MPFYQLSCRPVQLHRRPFQCMRLLPKNQPDHLQPFLPVWHGACLFNSPPHSLQFPAVDLRQFPQSGIGYRITGLGRGPPASRSGLGTSLCGAVLPAGHTVPGSGGSCLLHKATSRIVGYSIVLTSMPVLHGNAVLRAPAGWQPSRRRHPAHRTRQTCSPG